MSFFTWILHKGTYGPVLNYETDGEKWSLHVFIHPPTEFYVRLISRDGSANGFIIIAHNISRDAWTFVGFTYDYSVSKITLYIDGVRVKEAKTKKYTLNTIYKVSSYLISIKGLS